MKANLRNILIVVLAVLVVLLLFRVFACNRGKGSDHKPAMDLRDTLIQEYRHSLARDSAEKQRYRDTIAAKEARIEALKRERVTIQAKKQNVIKKSEQIKKDIDSDVFTADSLERAFANFE